MRLAVKISAILCCAAASHSFAQTADTYFGTVRASDIVSLSYATRGCVIELDEDAKRERDIASGQTLVKLDDLRAQLAVKTADARLSELQTALDERQLALEAARADERRRIEEREFVQKEFQRNSTMLGRGLINESAMETIERRFMDAKFTAERAVEAIANAETALKRAEIALEIGKLELQSAKIDLDNYSIIAPFDGVLVGFDANLGDCVAEGALSARIYSPDEKSVDVFFPISRLSDPNSKNLAVGSSVKITRVNQETCAGTITRLDTEADPETQFVEATVDVEPNCASQLFINEAVEIEPQTNPQN